MIKSNYCAPQWIGWYSILLWTKLWIWQKMSKSFLIITQLSIGSPVWSMNQSVTQSLNIHWCVVHRSFYFQHQSKLPTNGFGHVDGLTTTINSMSSNPTHFWCPSNQDISETECASYSWREFRSHCSVMRWVLLCSNDFCKFPVSWLLFLFFRKYILNTRWESWISPKLSYILEQQLSFIVVVMVKVMH